MKIIGDELSPNEQKSIEDFIYSLDIIDPFNISEYIFTVRKKDNILTILSHHKDGYLMPSYKILSPDSTSYHRIKEDININSHDVIVLIVNSFNLLDDVNLDIYDNYSYHEYHTINSSSYCK